MLISKLTDLEGVSVKRVLVEAAVILLVPLMVALVYNAGSPKRIKIIVSGGGSSRAQQSAGPFVKGQPESWPCLGGRYAHR